MNKRGVFFLQKKARKNKIKQKIEIDSLLSSQFLLKYKNQCGVCFKILGFYKLVFKTNLRKK